MASSRKATTCCERRLILALCSASFAFLSSFTCLYQCSALASCSRNAWISARSSAPRDQSFLIRSSSSSKSLRSPTPSSEPLTWPLIPLPAWLIWSSSSSSSILVSFIAELPALPAPNFRPPTPARPGFPGREPGKKGATSALAFKSASSSSLAFWTLSISSLNSVRSWPSFKLESLCSLSFSSSCLCSSKSSQGFLVFQPASVLARSSSRFAAFNSDLIACNSASFAF
mmetsp:Transcript_102112/g.255878  ORF Transcript_102112/g.255878 Transcript_102112/m.255878 type:complete len:229 (-) Transcript_102112:1132-1818(-)